MTRDTRVGGTWTLLHSFQFSVDLFIFIAKNKENSFPFNSFIDIAFI